MKIFHDLLNDKKSDLILFELLKGNTTLNQTKILRRIKVNFSYGSHQFKGLADIGLIEIKKNGREYIPSLTEVGHKIAMLKFEINSILKKYCSESFIKKSM